MADFTFYLAYMTRVFTKGYIIISICVLKMARLTIDGFLATWLIKRNNPSFY